MLYTEDFSMRHYVGFLQIGSHMSNGLICGYMYGIHNKELLQHVSHEFATIHRNFTITR